MRHRLQGSSFNLLFSSLCLIYSRAMVFEWNFIAEESDTSFLNPVLLSSLR